MLVLQDCIDKLTGFKKTFAQKFGITKLGMPEKRIPRIVILILLWRLKSPLCN